MLSWVGNDHVIGLNNSLAKESGLYVNIIGYNCTANLFSRQRKMGGFRFNFVAVYCQHTDVLFSANDPINSILLGDCIVSSAFGCFSKHKKIQGSQVKPSVHQNFGGEK